MLKCIKTYKINFILEENTLNSDKQISTKKTSKTL